MEQKGVWTHVRSELCQQSPKGPKLNRLHLSDKKGLHFGETFQGFCPGELWKKLVQCSIVIVIFFLMHQLNVWCIIIPLSTSHPNLASPLQFNTSFLVITVQNTEWEEPIFEFTNVSSQEGLCGGEKKKKKKVFVGVSESAEKEQLSACWNLEFR